MAGTISSPAAALSALEQSVTRVGPSFWLIVGGAILVVLLGKLWVYIDEADESANEPAEGPNGHAP